MINQRFFAIGILLAVVIVGTCSAQEDSLGALEIFSCVSNLNTSIVIVILESTENQVTNSWLTSEFRKQNHFDYDDEKSNPTTWSCTNEKTGKKLVPLATSKIPVGNSYGDENGSNLEDAKEN